MLNILAKNKLRHPITVHPGDTVIISHQKVDQHGTVVKSQEACRYEVKEGMQHLDTACVFELRDEMGMQHGIGGFLGRAQ